MLFLFMADNIKFKISFVDTRNGSCLFSEITKPMLTNGGMPGIYHFVDRYKRYLFEHPYTRLIISPLVSVDSGELFNIKNDLKNE